MCKVFYKYSTASFPHHTHLKLQNTCTQAYFHILRFYKETVFRNFIFFVFFSPHFLPPQKIHNVESYYSFRSPWTPHLLSNSGRLKKLPRPRWHCLALRSQAGAGVRTARFCLKEGILLPRMGHCNTKYTQNLNGFHLEALLKPLPGRVVQGQSERLWKVVSGSWRKSQRNHIWIC